MIKVITADCGEGTKKLWAESKKAVDDSMIMEIEIEREVVDITDGLGVTVEKMYTGKFEIKIRCMTINKEE